MALQVFSASNATVLVALAAAAIALAFFRFIIYQNHFSPLSRVPAAHPLAKITSLWIQWHRWRGTEFDCITSAIAASGPYIRVGPNEVILNAIDAVQNVYGVGANNFDRHPSYDYFITQGTRNMFTSLGKDHRSKRRRISSIYSRSFLQTSPPRLPRSVRPGFLLLEAAVAGALASTLQWS
ncbi:uncharacterized protein LMH87_009184 [Akanthomyces muscarius]|uniref:Cytochrome P450 n=1 Tax=Akanthomyces muscarius TaxID=2231603 RepID=A0A9W8QIP1_AKAMU|nr:uncharacterized protein LMH87_009184 [Akanthomyces muscarius]KAJ4158668.1 hypothetical protein LMH87_009184 [Akanthomyces muscarius]